MIDNNADKNKATSEGWTPLHLSAFTGHEQVCKILLKDQVVKDPLDNVGYTPLQAAAAEGHPDVCKILIDNIV